MAQADLVVAAPGTIVGRVTSEKGGEPFAGLQMQAFRDDQPVGSVQTDAQGEYRIERLQPVRGGWRLASARFTVPIVRPVARKRVL